MNTKVARVLSRAFSTIMVASLLVLSLATPLVSAAGEVVSIPNVTLQDEPQTVPINLQGFTNLGSLTVTLAWDGSLVDVALAQGNLPGGATLGNPETNNPVSISYFSGAGVSGNFILAYVTLTPLDTGGGTLDLSVTVCTDTLSAPIVPTVTDGTLTVDPPTEVWVDDDWCEASATDGDIVGDGYVYGYNAFCTIQEGVDAVSGSTVHVLAGNYDGFVIDYTDGLDVLGEDGAVVNGMTVPGIGGVDEALCLINDCSNVLVQDLEFDGNAFNGTGDAAVACFDCTGTTLDGLAIYDCNDTLAGFSYGIYVSGESAQTVDVVAPAISACEVGIYVVQDAINVTGGSIQGGGTGASYNSTGILVDYFSTANVDGTEVFDCASVTLPPAPEPGVSADPAGCGIYVETDSSAIVFGCCDIHDNDVGIFVRGIEPVNPQPDEPGKGTSGWLDANGNSIHDNRLWGVYFDFGFRGVLDDSDPTLLLVPALDCEENWWGDEQGPTVAPLTGEEAGPPLTILKGDWVTYGVDYSPWLDAPCPSGDPVGINAKLKANVRSGEPGLEVEFTDLSTPAPGCDIVEWLWDFGDDQTSTEENPSHIYMKPGLYTVTLTVVDSCGFRDSITMKTYITIKSSEDDEEEPANMVVSYLLIDPLQVLPGQEVLVSGNVCNQGEERGSKTVSLMVNGVAEQSQTVGVSGGSCQQVSFRLSRAVPGTYQVAIDGMTGQFSVLAPRTVTNNVPSQQDTGLGTAGIIAIIAILVALIAALIFLFRR